MMRLLLLMQCVSTILLLLVAEAELILAILCAVGSFNLLQCIILYNLTKCKITSVVSKAVK